MSYPAQLIIQSLGMLKIVSPYVNSIGCLVVNDQCLFILNSWEEPIL